MDIFDSFIEVPGGRVFARQWRYASGAVDVAPIVLLHDSLGCVDLWRDFPQALAAVTGRNVVAYDRLGFGRSSERRARPSIDFIDEEAQGCFPAIQQALGLGRFSVFGHSVGGAMALRIAASQSEACQEVISESAQAFVEPRTLAGIRSAKTRFQDPEQLEKLARWHGEKAHWVLDAWTEVWLSPQFSPWSLDRHLREVRCPALVIHGDSDEYGSEAFPRRIASHVAGPVQLEILEHCGHVPHRERRDDVLRLTAAFLARGAQGEPEVALRAGSLASAVKAATSETA